MLRVGIVVAAVGEAHVLVRGADADAVHGCRCGCLWYCSRSEANRPVLVGQAVYPGAPVAVAGNAEKVVAITLLHGHQGVACHLVCQAVLRLAGERGQGHGHRSVAVERIVVDGGGTRQGAPQGSGAFALNPFPAGDLHLSGFHAALVLPPLHCHGELLVFQVRAKVVHLVHVAGGINPGALDEEVGGGGGGGGHRVRVVN